MASNTVLKSSSQRAIRTKLVSQYPLLSRLAPPSPDDAPATVATPAKKGKKGGKGQPEEAVEEEGEQVVTVLDRIWPKKESLFLVKWSVSPPSRCAGALNSVAAATMSRY